MLAPASQSPIITSVSGCNYRVISNDSNCLFCLHTFSRPKVASLFQILCVYAGKKISLNKQINYWKENILWINKPDRLCLCLTQEERRWGWPRREQSVLSAGRRGERLSNWLLFLSLGGERSGAISDFIPHFFEAKLKSVQIPPTFLLLHHHGALNLLDSKNDACYSLSSILHLSAEWEASSASHLGRSLKLHTQLSAWLSQGSPSLDKHAFATGVLRDLGCCLDQVPS